MRASREDDGGLQLPAARGIQSKVGVSTTTAEDEERGGQGKMMKEEDDERNHGEGNDKNERNWRNRQEDIATAGRHQSFEAR